MRAPVVRSASRSTLEADSASLEVEGWEEIRDREGETTCNILEEAGITRVAKCEWCERTERNGKSKSNPDSTHLDRRRAFDCGEASPPRGSWRLGHRNQKPSERDPESLWRPRGDSGSQGGGSGMRRGPWACCWHHYRHQRLSYRRRELRTPPHLHLPLHHRPRRGGGCGGGSGVQAWGRRASDPREPA